MGACDISLIIGKKATTGEILEAFKAQREEDRIQNGHQDGYSGDFQTVDRVEYHLDRVFTSYSEAMEYCLAHSEKFCNVVAVYYIQVDIEASAKQKKLEERIVKLKTEERDLHRLNNNIGFVTCSHCRSRLNKKHLVHKTCRLCNCPLLTAAELRKSDRIGKKIKELQAQVEQLKTIAKQKALAKNNNKNLKTLIAGWGAC